MSNNIFKQDPLAQFLSGKREFLYKSLDEVIALINEREQNGNRGHFSVCSSNKYLIKLEELRLE